MFDLTNQVALITGASRGIGRAIANCFANKGAKVIVNYANNEEEAHKTLELMGENKKNALALKFDVSDEKEVEEAIDLIKEKYGTIDILVNNAGIGLDGLLMRLKLIDFQKQMDINLKGAFIVSKACTRLMIKNRKGRIINISSIVGEMGNAGQCAYAASKAGMIGFTKSLARELSSRNILVNAITPGYIETDMTKGMDPTEILKQIPLSRIGKPEDIATAALFLASPESSYITGHVLAVNGGMYI